MHIISWNVNSIRARIPNTIELIQKYNPDILLLQETRVEDSLFPFDAFDGLYANIGYNIKIKGQKGRNGVAIFSKYPLDDVQDDFCKEARYIQAFTGGIYVASVYVPNGQEIGVPQYYYKLEFLEQLLRKMLSLKNEIFVIGGDFNVAPYPCDIYIKGYEGITASPAERNAIAQIRAADFKDVLEGKGHTWWSYRQRGFKPNNGFRIDQFYLSPKAQQIFIDGKVLTDIRTQTRPSDHAPIYCELNI